MAGCFGSQEWFVSDKLIHAFFQHDAKLGKYIINIIILYNKIYQMLLNMFTGIDMLNK
jgi:hypothetical protein